MSPLSWLKTLPPPDRPRSVLVWVFVRVGFSLLAGTGVGWLVPDHPWAALACVSAFIVMLVVTTPLPMINWRRRGCTICGKRPAMAAPTGRIKPHRWFYPHERPVVEFVCAEHLYTWIKMRSVVDAK